MPRSSPVNVLTHVDGARRTALTSEAIDNRSIRNYGEAHTHTVTLTVNKRLRTLKTAPAINFLNK